MQSPLEILRLHRGPLVEPWKRKSRWCKVGADTYSVFTYPRGSDRSKWQGSAMQAPTCHDHFLNHRDQLKRIGRDAAIVGEARSCYRFSPKRVTALVYQRHLDVGRTYI